jgi:hypothetical protein
MIITEVVAQAGGKLRVVAEDERSGIFDINPYLQSPAFETLKNWDEFSQVCTRGYFIEWKCGADLSADTIEARWQRDDTRAPSSANA